MGIDTEAVLQAAGTKWDFRTVPSGPGGRSLHRRRPYLTHKAQSISTTRDRLAGTLNDSMGYAGVATGQGHDQARIRPQGVTLCW